MADAAPILPGQTWRPTRQGSKAKPRTVVWAGDDPPIRFKPGYATVGFVCDPTNPLFKESGHDSWISMGAFRAWIRKHEAMPDER